MRLILLVVFALAGCATLGTGPSYTEESMLTAAAAVTKVSAATEANLLYGDPPENLSDEAFLAQSVAHDPGLLAPFRGYQVKAMRKAGHTAILVCSQDGAIALLEDAGCTAAMDLHRWKDNPKGLCTFTLDLRQVCAQVPN